VNCRPVCINPETHECALGRSMVTYRRADGEPIGDFDFVLDTEYLDDDAEWGAPVAYVKERWVLAEDEQFTLPTCRQCDEPAEHWGLCLAHAMEDDPEAFTEDAS
jgi:hypothetical protein